MRRKFEYLLLLLKNKADWLREQGLFTLATVFWQSTAARCRVNSCRKLSRSFRRLETSSLSRLANLTTQVRFCSKLLGGKSSFIIHFGYPCHLLELPNNGELQREDYLPLKLPPLPSIDSAVESWVSGASNSRASNSNNVNNNNPNDSPPIYTAGNQCKCLINHIVIVILN